MAARKASKRIYNSVTKKYYAVRQKTTSMGRAGQIKGIWSTKNPKEESDRCPSKVDYRYERGSPLANGKWDIGIFNPTVPPKPRIP